jgi:hypothetical protein
LTGRYVGNVGYISHKIDYGGFLNYNHIEQGVFSYSFNYFTRLFFLGNFKFRYFSKINYKSGINRNRDEIIGTNQYMNIRGIGIEIDKGTKKLFVNNEFVAFSPLYLYGFRFVFFAFNDIGLIGTNSTTMFTNMPFTSIGIGMRIRNERLVFNTFILRLALFPSVPEESSSYPIEVLGSPEKFSETFYFSKPEIVKF